MEILSSEAIVVRVLQFEGREPASSIASTAAAQVKELEAVVLGQVLSEALDAYETGLEEGVESIETAWTSARGAGLSARTGSMKEKLQSFLETIENRLEACGLDFGKDSTSLSNVAAVIPLALTMAEACERSIFS